MIYKITDLLKRVYQHIFPFNLKDTLFRHIRTILRWLCGMWYVVSKQLFIIIVAIEVPEIGSTWYLTILMVVGFVIPAGVILGAFFVSYLRLAVYIKDWMISSWRDNIQTYESSDIERPIDECTPQIERRRYRKMLIEEINSNIVALRWRGRFITICLLVASFGLLPFLFSPQSKMLISWPIRLIVNSARITPGIGIVINMIIEYIEILSDSSLSQQESAVITLIFLGIASAYSFAIRAKMHKYEIIAHVRLNESDSLVIIRRLLKDHFVIIIFILTLIIYTYVQLFLL